MNNITPKPFDPTTGPSLRIVPRKNGWSLVSCAEQYENVCVVYPSYVFNSPEELAKAVANLVQFGSIEKPPEARVLRPGFRPIQEMPGYAAWWAFDTVTGIQERFVGSDGKCSPAGTSHSQGERLRDWIEWVGAIGFRLV